MPNKSEGIIDKIIEKLFIDITGKSLEVKPDIKPGHGSCCTCQVCGYSHDDCNCEVRRTVVLLQQFKQAIRQAIKDEMIWDGWHIK